MPSAIPPSDNELLQQSVIALRRVIKLLESNATIDPQQRQRITLDAITSGLTLTAVSTVTNIAAMAGEGVRQFEVHARNSYSSGIRSRLTFG